MKNIPVLGLAVQHRHKPLNHTAFNFVSDMMFASVLFKLMLLKGIISLGCIENSHNLLCVLFAVKIKVRKLLKIYHCWNIPDVNICWISVNITASQSISKLNSY